MKVDIQSEANSYMMKHFANLIIKNREREKMVKRLSISHVIQSILFEKDYNTESEWLGNFM